MAMCKDTLQEYDLTDDGNGPVKGPRRRRFRFLESGSCAANGCSSRRIPWCQVLWIVAIAAFTIFGLAGCGNLEFSSGPLLSDVAVEPDFISPNADGVDDVTEIFYSLRRPATISIYFEDEAGERTYFRRDRRRSEGDYSVYWGGVVDEPIDVETDGGTYEIVSRVLPDGEYTWGIEATDDNGTVASAGGTITLADADTEVPELHNFAVVPQIFRPNQDGLRDDWVSIGYYLTKDVEEVLLYLIDPADPGFRFFIPEEPGVVKTTERGFHEYRYEGGVDLNAEPPPDGTYQIIGEARDRCRQRRASHSGVDH